MTPQEFEKFAEGGVNAVPQPKKRTISIKKLVGGGYDEFWKFKGRYRVCKGSRASKKSKTTALNIIVRMMAYPLANTLVIRKYFSTLRDSFFKELKWAVATLGVEQHWKFTENPLEATYLPTGQKILFRGLDSGIKVTSITVDKGHLCWTVFEEAYEIDKEEDFDIIDESIRGQLPPGYFHQHTLIFNPWHECFLKTKFFDKVDGKTHMSEDGQIFAITTNYMCNEFLADSDFDMFERMKRDNPRRYAVAGLGEWGTDGDSVYENWDVQEFSWKEVLHRHKTNIAAFGLDFGFANDETAFVGAVLDKLNREIYIFAELYRKHMTNRQIYEAIDEMGFSQEQIIADCASPKDIAELRNEYGMYRIRPCRKGRDSIMNGIKLIQDYHIYIHPRCTNFIKEISGYVWEKNNKGEFTGRPVDKNNHLLDATRYMAMSNLRPAVFSFE